MKKKIKLFLNMMWLPLMAIGMTIGMLSKDIYILIFCLSWIIIDKLILIERWSMASASFLMEIKDFKKKLSEIKSINIVDLESAKNDEGSL